MTSKVAVIIGAGPGIGGCTAKRFASEGYKIALVSRKKDTLTPTEKEIVANGGTAISVTADATSEESLISAFKEIVQKLGHPEVLVYNPSFFIKSSILDIKRADMEKALNMGCLGPLCAAQQVLPKMVEGKKGTIIFTGATASLRGGAKFAAFATQKFAMRALAQSMAREFGPKGVHVVHSIIDGVVDGPNYVSDLDLNKKMKPESIAKAYWQLHDQDPSVWTLELDMRPYVEKF
mmetsp:Transcript_2424/g.2712  ORF Transcript_2424/g.2712 Transcript_2424/m.2712 type:complete len:235 (-) Transcript_2424:16-720(-)